MKRPATALFLRCFDRQGLFWCTSQGKAFIVPARLIAPIERLKPLGRIEPWRKR
jgi:hypothetical protein